MIYILCVVYSLLSVNCFMVVLARPRGKLIEWDSTISATYEWDAQDRRELECETKRYRQKHRYARLKRGQGDGEAHVKKVRGEGRPCVRIMVAKNQDFLITKYPLTFDKNDLLKDGKVCANLIAGLRLVASRRRNCTRSGPLVGFRKNDGIPVRSKNLQIAVLKILHPRLARSPPHTTVSTVPPNCATPGSLPRSLLPMVVCPCNLSISCRSLKPRSAEDTQEDRVPPISPSSCLSKIRNTTQSSDPGDCDQNFCYLAICSVIADAPHTHHHSEAHHHSKTHTIIPKSRVSSQAALIGATLALICDLQRYYHRRSLIQMQAGSIFPVPAP